MAQQNGEPLIQARGLVKSFGQAVLGFGFVFLGMRVMTEAMAPVADSPLARQVLVALSGNAGLGLLLGAVFSAGMTSLMNIRNERW